jgi:proline racemase
MAILVQDGLLQPGETLEAESIFGGRLSGVCTPIAEATKDRPAYAPRISGRAHLNGMSTLILEPDDPLRSGFL